MKYTEVVRNENNNDGDDITLENLQPPISLEIETEHDSVENRAESLHAQSPRCCWCYQILVDLALFPRNSYEFYSRLSHQFSWKFVAMVSIVYGINQGLGEGWYMFAGRWYLSSKPPKGLGLPADQMQSVSAFANIPWQVKSIYGILSDTFPINGYHRTPYIVIAGVFGLFSWTLLWLNPTSSVAIAAILLLFGNLSVASPDVMIDASVAEKCKVQPQYTTDLQSLCWISLGIGSVLSSLTAGILYEIIGSRGLFAITTTTALAMLYPATRGWLKEKPRRNVVSENEASDLNTPRIVSTTLREALQNPTKGPIYRLSILVLLISLSMGGIANILNDDFITLIAAILLSSLLSFLIYFFERDVSIRLAKASIYLYLSGAVQPNSQLIFYWSKRNPENCSGDYGNRPCFSPTFMSMLELFGYLVFIFGTACYNKYFSSWSYRGIWSFTQVLLAAAGFLDLILVMRWNLALGIPDTVFILGDEFLGDLILRFNTMPLFVLAACKAILYWIPFIMSLAICPDGVEATLFAMNMGLSNFGGTVGGYVGNGLIWFLNVEGPEYNNLPLFVVIRSMMRLLPLIFIPLLVPEGSPITEGQKDASSTTPIYSTETRNKHSKGEFKDSEPLLRNANGELDNT